MLARILLPAGRGELATVMLWPPILATIGLFGLSEATAFSVARRLISPGHIFSSAVVLAFTYSLILVPIGWVIIDYVSAGFEPDARFAAFLCLTFIPINHFGLVVVSMHQGGLSIGRWNVLRTSIHVAFTALIAIFALLGWGNVVGFTSAFLIANVITVTLGLIMARGHNWFAEYPKRENIRTLFTFGLKVHLVNAVTILNERMDQLLISLLMSPVDLGIYVVANTYARGVGAIGDTLGILVFPKIAHEKNASSQAIIAGRYARATLMLSIPTVGVGILLANWLIVTVFGRQFGPAGNVAQVLLLSIVPFNLKLVFTGILKAINRGLEAGAVQSGIFVLSLLLLALLLPMFGLMGAALAALCAQTIAASIMADRIRRALGLGFRDLLWPYPADVRYVFQASRRMTQRPEMEPPS